MRCPEAARDSSIDILLMEGAFGLQSTSKTDASIAGGRARKDRVLESEQAVLEPSADKRTIET